MARASSGMAMVDAGVDSGWDALPGVHDPEPEPDDSSDDSSVERTLWISVIAQAWNDAFTTPRSIPAGSTPGQADMVRGDARRWLTLDFGRWRDDRETVCELAVVDPDALRRMARKKLDSIKSERPGAEVIDLDEAFARLLAAESRMDPSELDAALSDLARLEAA